MYDLRVTVERIEGRSFCALAVCDYFEVTESSRVRIPEGKHFCLYALSAVLPILHAKQRKLPEGDWLAQDALAVHEVAPPGRPVDAPCDRCARHPLQEITHVLTTLLPSALDVLTVRLSSWYRAVQSVAQRHADGGRPACPDPAWS